MQNNDDLDGWCFISDTGMRLAEGAGLLKRDIILDAGIQIRPFFSHCISIPLTTPAKG